MANMLEGGGKTPILAPEELQALGFSLVAYPLSLLGVSIRAMENALIGLKSGRVPGVRDMGTFVDIQMAVGFPVSSSLVLCFFGQGRGRGRGWSSRDMGRLEDIQPLVMAVGSPERSGSSQQLLLGESSGYVWAVLAGGGWVLAYKA
jgi:hypothetical protein